MTNARNSIVMFTAAAAAVLAAGSSTGCATTSSVSPRGTNDLRSTASVFERHPQLLVTGPARLLHVDLDGNSRDPVTIFYRVARQDGTPADCRQGASPVWAESLRAPGLNRIVLDVEVSNGQVACLVVDRAAESERSGRPVLVSWHARQSAPGRVVTVALSSGPSSNLPSSSALGNARLP